jgi:hypothetical protein
MHDCVILFFKIIFSENDEDVDFGYVAFASPYLNYPLIKIK